ncbi:MAG: DMT family transporter [Gemmatimonadetes bacterium]|nr:DMT family transporter [Gemmatimonadota bacterium]
MIAWSANERRAAGAVVLAALGFSLISIQTIVATRDGVALSMFLLVRFVSATVVLTPFLPRDPAARPPRRTEANIAMVGGVGQSLVAVLTLASLRWIPAATLVVLFYTFPAWITLGAAWRGTERLTTGRAIALLLSLVGITCLVGWPGRAGVHPIGASLALAAAVVYAIYVPVISRVTAGVNAVRATWLVTTAVAVIFLVATAARGEMQLVMSLPAWGAGLMAGVASTALALLLFLRGLVTLGPVRTSIVCTVEPIFAAVLAAAVLDQPITLPMVVGGALIMTAVVVLSLSDAPRSR